MSNIIVQKFGGTSVASPKRIEAVAKIVSQEIDSGNHVAVVVSAMAGETNRLIDLAKKIQKKPDPREFDACLLYTSPSPRDVRSSRMPSSA